MIVNTMTAALITGKPMLMIGLTVMRPGPGHANTVSVTAGPAMNAATINTPNVSGGMRASRNACFRITAVVPPPLPRTSLMYSESKTYSMACRTMRIKPAEANQPGVAAGRM